ncbi:MAG: serine hydrolase [Gemmatimonadota bacterium]|nr:serine hydrolase [Gemmatimonadota bacterium]
MKRRRHPPLFVTLAILVVSASAVTPIPSHAQSDAGDSAPTVTEIDEWVRGAMDAWDIPGLALAVIVDGEVLMAKGYGVRQLGEPDLVDENTLFSIGSCSKAFGAAAVAHLVEARALEWDDRVTDYLPWFRLWDPWTTQELRVRDIVTHRVGTPSTQWLRPISKNRRDYLSRLQYGGRQHRFRDRFGYTNDMFILSGQLVETVSGERWNEYATESLWGPLGMSSTTALIDEANARPNHAMPHAFRERRYVGSHQGPGPALEPVPWQYVDDLMVPSGGIISSANDMAKWLRFHVGATDGPLSRTSIEWMHAPHTAIQQALSWMTFEGGGAYAMGWATGHFAGVRTVGHAGAALGFNCSTVMVPDEDFAVWSNVNRNSDLPYVLSKWIVARFFGDSEDRAMDWNAVQLERVAAQTDNARRVEAGRQAARLDQPPSLPLAEYAGSYENEFAGPLTIRVVEGSLDRRPSPAEGRAGRWDATPGLNELPGTDVSASSAGSTQPRLVAELDGRERPMQIELEHWHVDRFDGWWGDIKIGFSFEIDAQAKVSGVTLDYYGDFARKPH